MCVWRVHTAFDGMRIGALSTFIVATEYPHAVLRCYHC